MMLFVSQPSQACYFGKQERGWLGNEGRYLTLYSEKPSVSGLGGRSLPLTHKCLPALIFQILGFICEILSFYSATGIQESPKCSPGHSYLNLFLWFFIRAAEGITRGGPLPFSPLKHSPVLVVSKWFLVLFQKITHPGKIQWLGQTPKLLALLWWGNFRFPSACQFLGWEFDFKGTDAWELLD